MKCAMTLTALAAATISSAASAGLIYQTNFNNYTLGDVNGQNGWGTYDPTNTTGGGGFANVVASGNGSQGLQLNSGTGATTSPRYAWPAGYGSQWQAEAAAGNTKLSVSCDMYMASGSTSTARIGMVSFDSTGSKILTGYYVQANTGLVYLLANYNNAGTINNFAFNTNVTMGFDQWVTFTTTWDAVTGRMEVSWGANAFYVDGAAAGSIADETDFYATRNASTVATSATFDNLSISAIPAPGAIALLGVAGLVSRRRRA